MYFIIMETVRHLKVSKVFTWFFREEGHFECLLIWKLAIDPSHYNTFIQALLLLRILSLQNKSST